MTITEAQKELDELHKQLDIIRKEYDFGGWAKHCGREKAKPLRERADKLCLAITKAKDTIQIEI